MIDYIAADLRRCCAQRVVAMPRCDMLYAFAMRLIWSFIFVISMLIVAAA